MQFNMQINVQLKPIVLIPADVRNLGGHDFHAVGHKYIMAIIVAAGAMPLVVPSIESHLDIDTLLSVADGILLTGSQSNVHPSHYGQDVYNTALPLDTARDALTLKLIHVAIEKQVPILAICRGFQELNVAFGGSLHQAVQEVEGFTDHREDKFQSQDLQYAPSHKISLVANGQLANLLKIDEIMVNSLHGQGIDRMGAGLIAEAFAQDGLIEAVRVEGAQAFALGVQWHPEWQVMLNAHYLAIFNSFGDACKLRSKLRTPLVKPPD